jgi:hypothetical protein
MKRDINRRLDQLEAVNTPRHVVYFNDEAVPPNQRGLVIVVPRRNSTTDEGVRQNAAKDTP